MSDNIRNQVHFLMLMASDDTSRQQKDALLQTINKDQVRAVSEACYNVLIGHLQITEPERARLRRYAKTLREVGDKRNTIVNRRQLLTVPLLEAVLKILIRYIQPLLEQDSE